MAIAIDVEERIERSPSEVWRALTDWKNAPKWMKGVEEMVANGPTAVGTKLDFHARGKSRLGEITRMDPGRVITLTSRQGPVTADYTYHCEPDGTATRLRLTAACVISGPMKLFGPLLRIAVRRTDSGQVRELKALIEGDGALT